MINPFQKILRDLGHKLFSLLYLSFSTLQFKISHDYITYKSKKSSSFTIYKDHVEVQVNKSKDKGIITLERPMTTVHPAASNLVESLIKCQCPGFTGILGGGHGGQGDREHVMSQGNLIQLDLYGQVVVFFNVVQILLI